MNELSMSMSEASGPHASATLPEAPAKVTARGLNFYYGENHALKNINLTLGAHRVTAFIGPSGCGKSKMCIRDSIPMPEPVVKLIEKTWSADIKS